MTPTRTVRPWYAELWKAKGHRLATAAIGPAMFGFLLAVPKVNLLSFPPSTIGLKPEDILVLVFICSFPLWTTVNGFTVRRQLALFSVFAVLGLYLVILLLTTILYDGSMLYWSRYILYFSPLLLAIGVLPARQKVCQILERMAYIGLYAHFAVAVAQAQRWIGGYLVGNYEPNVSDRPMSVFSNATELGAVTSILYGLVLGSKLSTPHKVAALALAVGINVLSKNRFALVALIIVTIPPLLQSIRLYPTSARLWKTPLLAVALILAPGVVLVGQGLSTTAFERFGTLLSAENLEYIVEYVPAHWAEGANLEIRDVELIDPESSAVDKSMAWRIQKWTRAVSIITSGHVLGIGAGNSGQGSDGFLFRILGESGVIGVLLYALILAVVWRIALKRDSAMNGFRWVFWGLLLQAIVLDVYYFSRIGYMFWLLCALKLSNSIGRLRETSLSKSA